MSNPFKNFPNNFLEKWQNIADLLAQIINVPAALIMKTENEFMEVLISSDSKHNPYHPGDKEHWHGLYCETVIKSQKELLIPDALKDKKWDKNPDIKLAMIAYLGIPINFPNNHPFGTICVLDNKENQFSTEHKALLYQFKNVIEFDLALIQSLDWNKNNEDFDIIQKLHEQNEEYLGINEELKAQSEEISEAKERAEESEARYRTLFENMNTGFVLFEVVENKQGIPIDLIILAANEGFEKTTGLNLKDAVGMHLTKVLPGIEKDEADWIGTYSKVAHTRESTQFEQGSELLGYYYSISAFYAGPKQCAVTFQDITERKQAENALLAKIDELEHFHKLTVGREITMVELKKEVNNLLNKLGQDNKYKIVE